MPVKYTLTPELRLKLKQPIGRLIRGSFSETTKRFIDIVRKESPPIIISVGDTVSRNLATTKIGAKLSIIDNKCMRKSAQPFLIAAVKSVYVRNPQGTITDEAIEAIKNALQSDVNVRMIVEGEEDLLALTAIMQAPVDSLVLYGQPFEGIVVVKVTPDKKAEVSGILEAMEKSRKTK
jgi:uncharacterized protein (UPF0218 family)